MYIILNPLVHHTILYFFFELSSDGIKIEKQNYTNTLAELGIEDGDTVEIEKNKGHDG